MNNIMRIELYKFYKKKYFLSLCLLACLPLLFSLGAYFKWEGIRVPAKLDLITFVTSMWDFMLVVILPLILLLMIVSTSVSGEIAEGQILLLLSRVADKKKIIYGKFLACALSLLGFYLVTGLVSFLSYAFLLSKTSNGYEDVFLTHSYNGQSLLFSLSGFFFTLFLMAIAFYVSVNQSVLVATLSGFIGYYICKFFTSLSLIGAFVPGYFNLVSDYSYTNERLLYQYAIQLFLTPFLVFLAAKRFEKKDY